jgi:hypothetical protein
MHGGNALLCVSLFSEFSYIYRLKTTKDENKGMKVAICQRRVLGIRVRLRGDLAGCLWKMRGGRDLGAAWRSGGSGFTVLRFELFGEGNEGWNDEGGKGDAKPINQRALQGHGKGMLGGLAFECRTCWMGKG